MTPAEEKKRIREDALEEAAAIAEHPPNHVAAWDQNGGNGEPHCCSVARAIAASIRAAK